MTGQIFIDGKDIYLQYGVFVTEGGLNSLVAMPPLKTVKSNEWQEDDGVEADLSAPVLNTREVQMNFAFATVFNRLNAFIDMLSDGAYHEFDCAVIGRHYRLRMTQQPSLDYSVQLGFVSIKFADDFPLRGYTYLNPESTIEATEDYSFDGLRFSDYGVRVLKGTLTEIMKLPAVKLNLLRNGKTLAGAEYDGLRVNYKSKEVKMNCLMRAATLDELWRNYDALLYDLIRPSERLLWVNDIEMDFPFHYKSCTVTNFYPIGKIWLEFTLTLVFTRDFRIGEDDVILATEDSIVVCTENDVYAIDLMPSKYSYPSLRFVNNMATMRFTGNGAMRFND